MVDRPGVAFVVIAALEHADTVGYGPELDKPGPDGEQDSQGQESDECGGAPE